MTDHLAIVAPDEDFWASMEPLFAAAAIELTLIRKLDLFVEHHLDPANTVVLIDADQNVDRRANFLSGLVRNRFVGVVTVSRELSHSERLALLYMGADHCLVRPVDGEELAAIISNMFRHARIAAAPAPRDELTLPWKLDLRQWRLTTPGGHDVGLSAGEMSLLATLFREPGKTHQRNDLRAQSATAGAGVGRSLDVQISRLRRKVEDASSMTLPLRSSRGAGYVFASPATIISADALRPELGVHRIWTTASTCTLKSPGRRMTPTAERACRPRSSKTSTIRLEQPLMTRSWSRKSGGRLHEADDLQHPVDPVQIALAGRPHGRDQIDAAEPGRGDGHLQIDVVADHALDAEILDLRTLARDVDQPSRLGEGHVVPGRRGERREVDPQVSQARLYPGHVSPLRRSIVR